MKIAFIRGAYLNNFELQSYQTIINDKNIDFTLFSSKHPKHQVLGHNQKLSSPTDLPDFPKKLPILNRLCFGDAMYLFNLEKNLKDFDLAHVRETYFHYSSQAIKAKQKGIVKKVLVTCSETIPFNHETIPGRKKLKKTVKKNADHFHTLTEKAKKCLIREGVKESKVTVIPYGINLQKFYPPRYRNFNNRKLKILFIGRLEEQKGFKELLEVWPKLSNEHPNLELEIIGNGPLKSSLTVHNLKTNFYPYDQIPHIMQNSDLLVLPSKNTRFWQEYFGMVLLEAMACGLPIVTTDSGAIPEVIGNSGIITRNGDTKSLYHGINLLLKNDYLRKKYSAMGLKRVRQNFDAANQSEKIKNLYYRLSI